MTGRGTPGGKNANQFPPLPSHTASWELATATKLEELQTANAASKKEIASYKSQLAAATKENTNIRVHAENLVSQITLLQNSVKNLETQMQEQYEKYEADRQSLLAQISALQSAPASQPASNQPELPPGRALKRKLTNGEADCMEPAEVRQLQSDVAAIQQALRELTGPALADLVKKAINDALGCPGMENSRGTGRSNHQPRDSRSKTPAGRQTTGGKRKKSHIRPPPGLTPSRQQQPSVAPQPSSYALTVSSSQSTASGSRQTAATAEEWLDVPTRRKTGSRKAAAVELKAAVAPTKPIYMARPKPNTVLLVPTTPGQNVLKELEKSKISHPRELGVERQVPFPSGAALITCKDETALRKFSQVVAGVSSVSQKAAPRAKVPTLRVHGIPKEISADMLRQEFQDRFGEQPSQVLFVDYASADNTSTKMGVVEVSNDLYEAAQNVWTISVGWVRCRLVAQPHITRCTHCGLLGHPQKYCRNLADAKRAPPEREEQPCRDCTAYNRNLGSGPAALRRKRPTEYCSNDPLCPTLKSFYRKALPTRPEPATNTEAPQAAPQNNELSTMMDGVEHHHG